jgi:hypothetical protein
MVRTPRRGRGNSGQYLVCSTQLPLSIAQYLEPADLLLHYAVPALYVLYWWSDAAKTVLRWTHPLLWSSYPAAYLAYSLARGYLVGSYPYPFIDAGHIGYARTMQNALGLLIVFIVLGLLIVALGRVRQRIGR